MHSVNLDLLRTTPHHPDGQPRDAHARHRAEHLATLRAARRARWQAALSRALALLPALRAKPIPRKAEQVARP